MANTIIGYDHPNYMALYNQMTDDAKHNGLWYYAHTLQDKLVPLLNTNRPIDVIGKRACGTVDHAVVFIHTNVPCEKEYPWLANYNDLVLVCSIQQTVDTLKSMFPQHKVILLPLCVDAEEIKKHKTKKDQEAGYFGNAWNFKKKDLEKFVPPEVHRFGTMPREQMLSIMAHYKKVYAVGLTAIEAQILGADILPCDSRFPDPKSVFVPLDYHEAVEILQAQLDEIDKPTIEPKPVENTKPQVHYGKSVIISHENPEFVELRNQLGQYGHNGGYYYSKEIVENIIPKVETDRSWITVCMRDKIVPHSIFIVHEAVQMDQYEWMKGLSEMDIIAVCSKKNAMIYFEGLRCVKKSVFLPLSIDTKYLKQFYQKEKDEDICFYGNKWAHKIPHLICPDNVPHLVGPRDECLAKLAHYRRCYATDRCALEAKALGVEVLPTDDRFSPDIFRVYDNSDAAKILQSELDYIDKEF